MDVCMIYVRSVKYITKLTLMTTVELIKKNYLFKLHDNFYLFLGLMAYQPSLGI